MAELTQLIRDALLHEWDPIGVGDFPEANDEYDSYVPDVYHLLTTNKSESEILTYLWWLETEHMGLGGDRPATEKFAQRLITLRDE